MTLSFSIPEREFIPKKILILFEETRPLRAEFFKNQMGPSAKLGPYLQNSQALRPGFTSRM
jgi:hypothetical protein